MLDISSHAINSYQKGQNIGHRVDETAAAQKSTAKASPKQADLSVNISDKYQIFDWIAYQFNHELSHSGRVAPIAQTLFDYGLIDLVEQKTINELSVKHAEQPLLTTAVTELSESTSYQERKTLTAIVRLFSTLDAAANATAA